MYLYMYLVNMTNNLEDWQDVANALPKDASTKVGVQHVYGTPGETKSAVLSAGYYAMHFHGMSQVRVDIKFQLMKGAVGNESWASLLGHRGPKGRVTHDRGLPSRIGSSWVSIDPGSELVLYSPVGVFTVVAPEGVDFDILGPYDLKITKMPGSGTPSPPTNLVTVSDGI